MKIKFSPQNIVVEGNPDKTLLQIATENHIEIKSICKGVPSCAECRVRIVSGENNIIPPGKPELSLIGTSYHLDSRRLSCQVRCFGDVEVDLTEQIERAENQTKKVRGFRTSKHVESQAIQDTMILNEKIDTNPKPSDNRQEVKDPTVAVRADAPAERSNERQGERHGERKNQQNRPQREQNRPKQGSNNNQDNRNKRNRS